jgi:5-methyltetrahydropteroyltriglutamate--homocysteine methyltransferase
LTNLREQKMPSGTDRILTSHVGSLPRPEGLIALNHRRAAGDAADRAAYDQELADAVATVVRRQQQAGIDVVNNGEFGHAMGQRYDYGAWWSYVFRQRGHPEIAWAKLEALVQGAELASSRLHPPGA